MTKKLTLRRKNYEQELAKVLVPFSEKWLKLLMCDDLKHVLELTDEITDEDCDCDILLEKCGIVRDIVRMLDERNILNLLSTGVLEMMIKYDLTEDYEEIDCYGEVTLHGKLQAAYQAKLS